MQNRYDRYTYSSTTTSTGTSTTEVTTYDLCASMKSIMDNHGTDDGVPFIKKTSSLNGLSWIGEDARDPRDPRDSNDVEAGEGSGTERFGSHWGQFVDVEKLTTYLDRRNAACARRLQNRYPRWGANMEKIDEDGSGWNWSGGWNWVWSVPATYIGAAFAQNTYVRRAVGVVQTVSPQMYVIAMSCVGVAIVCM